MIPADSEHSAIFQCLQASCLSCITCMHSVHESRRSIDVWMPYEKKQNKSWWVNTARFRSPSCLYWRSMYTHDEPGFPAGCPSKDYPHSFRGCLSRLAGGGLGEGETSQIKQLQIVFRCGCLIAYRSSFVGRLFSCSSTNLSMQRSQERCCSSALAADLPLKLRHKTRDSSHAIFVCCLD